LYGHNCRSKRGRKRKSSKSLSENNLQDEISEPKKEVLIEEKPKEEKREKIVQPAEKKEKNLPPEIIKSPEYVKILIANNEEALKQFDEKIKNKETKEKIDELVKLQQEIEERLKNTQNVLHNIDDIDKKDEYLVTQN